MDWNDMIMGLACMQITNSCSNGHISHPKCRVSGGCISRPTVTYRSQLLLVLLDMRRRSMLISENF